MSSVVHPQQLLKIFEKELSKTDAESRFAFPIQHLHHLMCNPDECRTTPFEFNVVDLDGNSFVFRLTGRREGYLKPEITGGGWLRFVRHKSLNPYDRVTFYKHPIVGGVVFTEAVRMAVRVFGAVLGHAQRQE